MMERRTISPERALERLENLCARSEHCEYELETKLRGWGIAGAQAEEIMESLRRGRFVDDARFAEAFANDKVRFAGHGRLKIRISLIAKHISRDVIDDALASIDDDEYAGVLAELLRAKRRQLPDPESYESRAKLYRYAAGRGFESSLITSLMRQIAEEE